MIGLLVFAAIWALAVWKQPPRWQAWGLAGLWWLVILWAHAPWVGSDPLARLTGGEFRAWLVFGVILAGVGLYRVLFAAVKARARPVAVPVPPTGPFSQAELDRYARHILLREIGGPGQRKLKEARVLVVGAGGLGSPVLLYLAAAGVGTIGVIDDDAVSNSNLQRQVIHTDARIGMPKVFSAQAQMLALNPHVTVRPYNRRLTAKDAAALFADYDLIVDGTDNFATRRLVNAAAVAAGKPLISGAIAQWEGQVTLFDPARGAPCLSCVFPTDPAPGLAPSCAEAGVVGALPGVIGAMMALEVIKEITGAGRSARGRLILQDGLWGESREIAVQRRADCPVCGRV